MHSLLKLSLLLAAAVGFPSPIAAQTASTNSLTFSYNPGQPAPLSQSVTIYNATGAVTARISQNVDASGNPVTVAADNSGLFAASVSPNSDGTWSLAGGINPYNPGILASLAAKGQGTYSGAVLVSATGCNDCIAIQMFVQISGGNLTVLWNGGPATSGVTIAAATASTAQTTLLVVTSASTNFTVTTNQWWLLVSPTTGTTGAGTAGGALVNLSASSSGLPAGANYATLTVASGAGTATIPVTFNVGTPGGLTLSPAVMNFQYSLAAASYPLGQSNGLTISGTTAGSAFTANSTANWLLVNGAISATGIVGSTVTISVNPLALGNPPPVNSYTGTVYFYANGLTGTLTATLSITGSIAGANPLTFYTSVAGGYTAPQYVTVSGNGSYSTQVTRNMGGTNWLSVTPAYGTLGNNATLAVAVNSAGLPAGTYTGSIQVYVNGSPQQGFSVVMYVGVTGVVGTVAAPGSLSFSVPPWGSQSQSMIVNGGGGAYTAQPYGQGISVTPTYGATTPALLTVSVNAAGLGTGVFTGSVILQSSLGMQTIPVTINVVTGTMIQANPPSVAVFYHGGASVTNIQLTGTTDGTGGNQSFSVTAPGFVTLSSLFGVTPTTLAVGINSGALGYGFNTGDIVITSSGAANSPLRIPVTVFSGTTSTSGLAVTPNLLTLTGVTGGAAVSNWVTVSGLTGGAFSTAVSNGGSWLSVSPASATSPATLLVTANPASLAVGMYQGSVIVSTFSGVAVTLSVVLTVTGRGGVPPILSVTGNQLTFDYQLGGSSPPPQTIEVNASGSSAGFSVASSAAWIVATPASGSTPANLSISVKPAGLGLGTQTGTVAVNSPGSQNTPQIITVTLHVTNPPLVVSHTSMQFVYRQGGAAPAAQTMRVTCSGRPLSFTVSAASAAWFSVSPSSGATPSTLTFNVNPAGMTLGDHSGSVDINAPGSSHTITVLLTVMAPFATISGIYNAASYRQGAIAPGEILTIMGTAIGPDRPAQADLNHAKVRTSLANTRVLVGGYPAPILYASSKQVTAIVPYAIAARSSTFVQVEYQGQTSNGVNVDVADAAPGVFALDGDGGGAGAILNQDGDLNSPSNPARTGSVIVLYATGEGQTAPAGVDGQMAHDWWDLPTPVLPVTATIAGVPARVLYAGAAPGEVAGLLQVNLLVPLNAVSGDVVLTIGGHASQKGLTVAIR